MIQLFEHGYIDFDFDLYPFNKDGYQLIIASKCKGVIYENDLSFFDNIMYNYNSLQELRDAISDDKLFEILYTKKVILFLSIQDIYKFLCLYLKIFVGQEYKEKYDDWIVYQFNKFAYYVLLKYPSEISMFELEKVPYFLTRNLFVDKFNVYFYETLKYEPNIEELYNNVTTNFVRYDILKYATPELMMMNHIFHTELLNDNLEQYTKQKVIKHLTSVRRLQYTPSMIQYVEKIVQPVVITNFYEAIDYIKYNEPKLYIKQNGDFFEYHPITYDYKFKFEMNYDKSTYQFIS